MPNIGSLQAQLGMPTRMLSRDMKQANSMFTGFGRRVSGMMAGVTRSIGGMGAAFATVGVGVAGAMAVTAFFRKANDAGMSFEQTMATVGGVMRATAEEMDLLTESARRMGETTEFTATQAASSLKFLGMAGFQASKAMAALPGTLALSTASSERVWKFRIQLERREL